MPPVCVHCYNHGTQNTAWQWEEGTPETCKMDPGEAVRTGSDAQKLLGKVSARATVSTLLTSSDGTSESSGRTPWALGPCCSPI